MCARAGCERGGTRGSRQRAKGGEGRAVVPFPVKTRSHAPCVESSSKMLRPTLKEAPASVAPTVGQRSSSQCENMLSHADLPSWAPPAIERTQMGAGALASAWSAAGWMFSVWLLASMLTNGMAPWAAEGTRVCSSFMTSVVSSAVGGNGTSAEEWEVDNRDSGGGARALSATTAGAAVGSSRRASRTCARLSIICPKQAKTASRLPGTSSRALIDEFIHCHTCIVFICHTVSQISTTDRTHARTGPDTRAQAHNHIDNHTQNSNTRTQPTVFICTVGMTVGRKEKNRTYKPP